MAAKFKLHHARVRSSCKVEPFCFTRRSDWAVQQTIKKKKKERKKTLVQHRRQLHPVRLRLTELQIEQADSPMVQTDGMEDNNR